MRVSSGAAIAEAPGMWGSRFHLAAGLLFAVPAYPALAVLVLTMLVVRPEMLTLPFAFVVLRQATPVGLAALGQGVVIRGRSLDLSIGGVIALVNVALSNRAVSSQHWAVGIAVALLIGVLAGTVNGLLVARVRASAVIVTLGISIILVGASFLISGGAPGGQIAPMIKYFAVGRLGMVPIAALIWLAAAVTLALVLRFLVFGRVLAAIGSNYRAAGLGGLPASQTMLLAHVVSGLMAGAAGLILSGYIGTGTMNLGADVVLTSIAACVLGGTNFGGGRGGVAGSVAGSIALVLLGTLLTSFGVPQPFKLILQGLVVAFAAALARR